MNLCLLEPSVDFLHRILLVYYIFQKELTQQVCKAMGCISRPALKRIYLYLKKLLVFGKWGCEYLGHSAEPNSILTQLLSKLQ